MCGDIGIDIGNIYWGQSRFIGISFNFFVLCSKWTVVFRPEVLYLDLLQKQTSIYSKNSIYLTHTGPDRCQIVEYSRLSDGTYTDPSCYR